MKYLNGIEMIDNNYKWIEICNPLFKVVLRFFFFFSFSSNQLHMYGWYHTIRINNSINHSKLSCANVQNKECRHKKMHNWKTTKSLNNTNTRTHLRSPKPYRSLQMDFTCEVNVAALTLQVLHAQVCRRGNPGMKE